jgi:hypothetical protein
MLFYLGTHMPSWLGKTDVPLFISHRKLMGRKTFPRALGRWALDSGAFSEVSMKGRFETTPAAYVGAVRRYSQEIGGMDWAAPQDWLCEPFVIEKTGLTVQEHQKRTTDNIGELRGLAPDLTFIPVLQGWEYGDYIDHVSMYEAAGFDLREEPTVGVGSVCHRQGTKDAHAIMVTLRSYGIKPHGFGVKLSGLAKYGLALESADSMAWSFDARYNEPMEGHTHKACASCMPYAMKWREAVA